MIAAIAEIFFLSDRSDHMETRLHRRNFSPSNWSAKFTAWIKRSRHEWASWSKTIKSLADADNIQLALVLMNKKKKICATCSKTNFIVLGIDRSNWFSFFLCCFTTAYAKLNNQLMNIRQWPNAISRIVFRCLKKVGLYVVKKKTGNYSSSHVWNICYSVDASGCSAKDLKNVVVLAEFLP